MENNELITIATTSIFVNVPKHLAGSIKKELIYDVQEQVVSQYREILNTQEFIPAKLEITNVNAIRGCIVIEISIGASIVALPAIYAALKDYKSFKESIYEIGKDVKHVWFWIKHLKVNKPVCVQKISIQDRVAIEQAIKKLEARNKQNR